MDLSAVPTDELRAEIARRKKAEDAAYWEAVRVAYPCPECGGDPRDVRQEVVEEFRFAPRDDDGRPMLYMPYDSELGTTGGVRDEITLTCENGHVTTTDRIRWFDKPVKGMPLLPR